VANLTFSTVSDRIHSVDCRDHVQDKNWLALPRKSALRPGMGMPMTALNPNAAASERRYRILVQ
jgi:hypothetical protein